MILRVRVDDLDLDPSPRIHTPQLVPALFAAAARAPLGLQARQLEVRCMSHGGL